MKNGFGLRDVPAQGLVQVFYIVLNAIYVRRNDVFLVLSSKQSFEIKTLR